MFFTVTTLVLEGFRIYICYVRDELSGIWLVFAVKAAITRTQTGSVTANWLECKV